MMETKKKALFYELMVLLSAAGANAMVVLVMQFLLSPLLPSLERSSRLIYQFLDGHPVWKYPFLMAQASSFLIPTVIIIFYIRPLSRFILNGSPVPVPERLQKKILHSPFVIALIGSLGWVIGISVTVLFFLFSGEIQSVRDWMVNLTSAATLAAFTFVYVYYMIEYFTRRFFIREFFPDNRITHIADGIRFSIKARFLLLYFSVAITPVFIFATIFLSRSGLFENPGLFWILLLASLVSGLDIILVLSSQFEKQLAVMKEVTGEIRNGNFEMVVPVISEDELGFLAESINEMNEGLKEKENIYETFGRVVDPEVRDHLLRGSLDPEGERREVTVLFTDIRGFTGMSEELPPEMIVNLLNRYLDRVNGIIRKNGGMINKFIGDAVMGVFNAPLENEDHRISALRSGREILESIRELNSELRSEGLNELKIGIGIHSGPVVAGTIGTRERQEYTVIGDTVNVASRLESLNKSTGTSILFTESVLDGLEFPARNLGKTQVRGKEQSLVVFTLESQKESNPPEKPPRETMDRS